MRPPLSPPVWTARRSSFEPRAKSFLEAWVAGGEVSLAVGGGSRNVPRGRRGEGAAPGPILVAAGWERRGRFASPASPASVLDYASLTKPFIAALALLLDRAGQLNLRSRVGDFFAVPGPLAGRTLESLLRHRAGLPAWLPLAALHLREPSELAGELARRAVPPALCRYSDLGYLLWGMAAERALAEPLAGLLRREVLAPLGLASVSPSPGGAPHVAFCECDGAKEQDLALALRIRIPVAEPPPIGQPQDGNARWLAPVGGLCGHAGLFGNAADLLRFAEEWLRPGGLLHAKEVERALSGSGAYALGWARRRVRGSAGPALPAGAFGHTGFAGGSLWIDPMRGRIHVLLAHRTNARSDLNSTRRAFHEIAES